MITTPIIIPIMNQQFGLGGGESGEVCFSLDTFRESHTCFFLTS